VRSLKWDLAVKCHDCDTSHDKRQQLCLSVSLHYYYVFFRLSFPLKTSRCLRTDYNFQQRRVTLLAHNALPDLPAGLCGIEIFLPARCYMPAYSRQSTHDSSTTTASPFVIPTDYLLHHSIPAPPAENAEPGSIGGSTKCTRCVWNALCLNGSFTGSYYSAIVMGGTSTLTRTRKLCWRDHEGYGEEESPR